jgi:DNA-binding LytR/AlgR family response regulator
LDHVGEVDIALVDMNLLDGPSGIEIARQLSAGGASVIFVTVNPKSVPADTDVAVGVMTKPVADKALALALKYLASAREGGRCVVRPTFSFSIKGAPQNLYRGRSKITTAKTFHSILVSGQSGEIRGAVVHSPAGKWRQLEAFMKK